MIGRKSIAAAALLAAVGYFASPYVMLWRLSAAVRGGDTAYLRAAIDWDSVRAGLKQDIADGIMGDLTPAPAPTTARTRLASADNAGIDAVPRPIGAGSIGGGSIGGGSIGGGSISGLPPFGASFVAGIAGSMIDRMVTPENIASMLHTLAEGGTGASGALTELQRGFFAGPTSFDVRVHCPGQDPQDEPLRLRLAFGADGWRVVRAWVPQDLVDLANSRT